VAVVIERWLRLDDRRLRNTTKSDSTCEARTFGLNGQPWPRITVVVRMDTYGTVGYRVSWSRKTGPGEWWYEHDPMPRDILVELPEMIIALLDKTAALSETNAQE